MRPRSKIEIVLEWLNPFPKPDEVLS